ncbi:unnamed protein product [Cylindrotheca closterium]|uniref:RRM domain-containing protein n=1 Tax=Cylindrotheca closterium TaxID=2856 RepID=A0AAD2CHD2_9STRA|nr:unnamed protein product [Cylindrotheca closterium]
MSCSSSNNSNNNKMYFLLCLWAAMLNHSESFASPPRTRISLQQYPQQDANNPSFTSSLLSLNVHTVRDADMYEMMMGGERYEMVPLPDSMLQTTLFVGNLNEFVHDDDLSRLFAPVTEWSSIPACVVRKPNMASLKYGFVTFPTEEQKNQALLRFHNAELQGKPLKVEEIRDHPKKGRVRVPEKMVAYVIGGIKNGSKSSRKNQVNTMRQVRSQTKLQKKIKRKEKIKNKRNNKTKPFSHPATTSTMMMDSVPEVQVQIQINEPPPPTKKQRRPSQQKAERYKLTSKEQEELQRALRKGYVTLEGTGFRRGRKSSNLACAHRQWCCLQASKPQIVLCKASGGRPLDCLIVDLSPLRERLLLLLLQHNDDDDDGVVLENAVVHHNHNNNGFLLGEQEEEQEEQENQEEESTTSDNELLWRLWNGPIIQAAQNAGMELRTDYIQDNTLSDLSAFQDLQDELVGFGNLPISQLPSISMGVFEGERSQAKAMARELANLWEIPQLDNGGGGGGAVCGVVTSGGGGGDKMVYSSKNGNHSKPNKKFKRSDHNSQRRQRRQRENDFFF